MANETPNQDNPQAAAADAGKQLAIQKIYLKDSSFEAPNTPEVFTSEWKPDVKLNVAMNNKMVNDDTVEIVLTITAEASNDGKTAFLCEVQQAGLFLMKGFNEVEKPQIYGVYIPNILFPYAREAVSDLVGKGGFPQLMLQPMPFDQLFAKAQAEARAKEAETH
ncbi:MAG: protein-export chaperone SecB [Pseudomonadota bacterium]